MADRVDVAVIGAGPFGLSIAAQLGARARMYGKPMQTWRERMPPDMLLRSAWEETSLSAPGGAGTIDAWARDRDEERAEPIPLQTFLRYAHWFEERFVHDAHQADVAVVEAAGSRLRVTAVDGSICEVDQVVLAVGVTPFPRAPHALAADLGAQISFAIEEADFARFAGKRVIVVGAGQAGLECAGIAAREGAEVEVLARSGVHWFADREPHHPRGPLGQRLYRLAYPAVGYGPPPLNRLVLYPDLFATLPRTLRRRLTDRLLRPGGSPWVRSLVDGKVRVTSGTVPISSEVRGETVRLALDDGTTREADHVLLATGYGFELERLAFLDPSLRAGVEVDGGWPRLDRSFRSTDPRVFFAGYAAEGRFGPLSRFVLGCEFTARRVSAALT